MSLMSVRCWTGLSNSLLLHEASIKTFHRSLQSNSVQIDLARHGITYRILFAQSPFTSSTRLRTTRPFTCIQLQEAQAVHNCQIETQLPQYACDISIHILICIDLILMIGKYARTLLWHSFGNTSKDSFRYRCCSTLHSAIHSNSSKLKRMSDNMQLDRLRYASCCKRPLSICNAYACTPRRALVVQICLNSFDLMMNFWCPQLHSGR